MARPGQSLVTQLKNLATRIGPDKTLAQAIEALEQTIPQAEASLHQEAIAAFYDLWGRLRGGRYRVLPQDARAVKELIHACPEATLPELKRRMTNALQDPWFQRAGTLALFCTRWSNYDRGLAPAPGVVARALREVVGRDENGRPQYA